MFNEKELQKKMKKAYITPSIQVCDISNVHIMAATIGIGEDGPNLGKAESYKDSFFEDDDDDLAGW